MAHAEEAPHRREEHRRGERLAEQSRADIYMGHIDQHALAQRERVESVAVAMERRFRIGAAG